MKRTMRCQVCYEPVFTIFGLDYVPIVSCETKKRTRIHGRKRINN